MTDEIPASPAHNLPEYSVSEISTALKRTVEEGYAWVRVRGEVSGFKRHSSGHLYFCLKDADAVLDAVSWRMQAMRLGVQPEDGIEVVATGRLTTYPGRSKYQMVVERMELAGQGALLKLLEDRRKKLAAEGLFDADRKKPIPFLPDVIGVVTSPTGAVIRDILHRIRERFPRPVLLWPVAVQGDTAAEQVAAAIRGFNAITPGGPVPRPDVLIVARGGGSLEDLWAFNEEVVVRAAAESDIPLISAVGHETDTTLIDYASDLRAPTPTGAAEKAVPVRIDLVAATGERGARLVRSFAAFVDQRRKHIQGLARGLPQPQRLIEGAAQRLDDRAERLANSLPNLVRRKRGDLERLAGRLRHPREVLQHKRHALDQLDLKLKHGLAAMAARQEARLQKDRWRVTQSAEKLESCLRALLDNRRQRLERAGALLESYSYRKTLDRGFAVVKDGSGALVATAATAQMGAAWQVEFKDGAVGVVVGPGGAAPKPKKEKKEQPTLF